MLCLTGGPISTKLLANIEHTHLQAQQKRAETRKSVALYGEPDPEPDLFIRSEETYNMLGFDIKNFHFASL